MSQHSEHEKSTGSVDQRKKQYPCPVCEKFFPSKHILKLHLGRRHGLVHFNDEGSDVQADSVDENKGGGESAGTGNPCYSCDHRCCCC